MKYQVFRRVNPNAHNVRYGRDCNAPAEGCGVVEAADEYARQGTRQNASVGCTALTRGSMSTCSTGQRR
jgi:hypothetical protein